MAETLNTEATNMTTVTLKASKPALQAESTALTSETENGGKLACPAFTGRDAVIDKPPGIRPIISRAWEPVWEVRLYPRGSTDTHMAEARVLSRVPCGLGVTSAEPGHRNSGLKVYRLMLILPRVSRALISSTSGAFCKAVRR